MNIHWFSDFVAGGMIGTTIGIVTGRSFRERLSTRVLESSRRDT
jgi:membrane-associated phospholipid phosphatase